LADSSQDSGSPGSDETIAAAEIATSLGGRADSLRRLERGTRVGRYTLLGLLGAGGMGVVYEAYDPELDRKVALKLLHGSGAGSLASKARREMLGEAKTLARLSHPNVVAVHDAGRIGDGPACGAVYLAMDLVEGTTLRDWVSEQTDWRTILTAYIEAGRGLAAAHRAGIIHRDFKPQNVLVNQDGDRLRVRVADFGLAVLEPTHGDEGSSDSTHEELPRLAGTPAYMAPEQIALEEVGPAADQFAFCVSLFEAVLGDHPFRRDTILEQADAVLNADPTIPSKARRIPQWLRRALFRGLSREPITRHRSMDALVATLALDRWKRLRRVLVAAAATTVIAGLGYAVAAYYEPGTVRVKVVDENGDALRGAVVRVGRETLELGPESHSGELAAGTYRLDATADNYVTHSTAIELDRGGEHIMTIALAHEQGKVDLEVQPHGATVLVDGVDRGSRLVDLSLDTGRHEIVARKVGHYERRMTVDIARGERTQAFVSLPTAVHFARRYTGPAYELQWGGDVNGDGRPEVYTRTFGQMTLIDPWKGQEVWSLHTKGIYSAMFLFDDFDGDGTTDLLRARDGLEGWLEVFPGAQDGDQPEPAWFKEWKVEDGDSNVVPTEATTTDVDGDGKADVVTAFRWQRGVVARSGLSGDVLWRHPLEEPALTLGATHDGGVVVMTSHALVAFDRTGTRQWKQVLPAGIVIPPEKRTHYARHRSRRIIHSSYDLDQDGTPDVIIPIRGHEDGGTWALNGKTGETLWFAQGSYDGPEYATHPLDVTGDGVVEVLLQRNVDGHAETRLVDAGTGEVRATMAGASAIFLEGYDPPRIFALSEGHAVAYSVDGTELGRSPTPSATRHAPIPFDHDGDGRMEAFVSDRSPGVRVFDGDGQDVGLVLTDAPVTALLSDGDADHDGYADLLVRSAGLLRVSAMQTLWSRSSRTGLRVTPLAVDADDDGDVEVAVYGDFQREQALHILDGATGRMLAIGMKNKVIRTPTTAELRGQPVVLAQSQDRRFTASSFLDGTPLVSVDTQMSYASPGVGDANDDGRTDVMLLPWNGGRIRMLELETQRELWGIDTDFGSFATPRIEDLDGQAPAEVVLGFNDGGLEVRDGASGSLRWRREMGPQKFSHAPAVGHLDGQTRLFVGDPGNETFHALDPSTGATVWTVQGSLPSSGPTTADVDDDGRSEIFTGTKTGLISYDWDGEVRWHHHTSTEAFAAYVSATGQVIIADLDHDGRLEVLSSFADGSVRVLDAETGALLVRFSGTGQGMETAPAPVDVDGDGLDELLVVGHDRWLRCLRLPPTAFRNRGERP